MIPTKGRYSYFIKLTCKRERQHSLSALYNLSNCWQNIGQVAIFCVDSLKWPMYWLLWVIGLIWVFAYIDWIQTFPFKPKLFSFTLGVLHLSAKPVNSHLTASEVLVFHLVNPEENPGVKEAWILWVLSTPGLMSPKGQGLLQSWYTFRAMQMETLAGFLSTRGQIVVDQERHESKFLNERAPSCTLPQVLPLCLSPKVTNISLLANQQGVFT